MATAAVEKIRAYRHHSIHEGSGIDEIRGILTEPAYTNCTNHHLFQRVSDQMRTEPRGVQATVIADDGTLTVISHELCTESNALAS